LVDFIYKKASINVDLRLIKSLIKKIKEKDHLG